MNAGHDRILGKQFGTVIYGAGKGIWKTFADYVNGAESYFLGIMNCSISEILIMRGF